MRRRGLTAAFTAAIALTIAAIAGISLHGPDRRAAQAAPSAAVQPAATEGAARLVLAGGCFWCVEADFDKVSGVLETTSGFSGGHTPEPSYREVTRGGTGHYEVVEIVYDPEIVSFRDLVDHFWRTIDPLDDGGQFCDRGSSYKTAIFVRNAEERREAEASKQAAAAVLGRPIVTEILDFEAFYPAEAYHQDYYIKNPIRYRFYREGCGRDRRLRALWGAAAAGGED
ncbi:MAG: hypothetical protein Tsb0010_05910 [Parvularculaceae bacterium]